MTGAVAGRAGNRPVRYQIVVRGELRPSAAGPLEGLEVRADDGSSVITGEIIDQAQLHGVLAWLGERGVEIVSVQAGNDTE
jgi:hypothetical protein